MLGTDRIAHWEHVVVEGFWKLVEMAYPNARQDKKAVDRAAVDAGILPDSQTREGGPGWGVEEAEVQAAKPDASTYHILATQTFSDADA